MKFLLSSQGKTIAQIEANGSDQLNARVNRTLQTWWDFRYIYITEKLDFNDLKNGGRRFITVDNGQQKCWQFVTISVIN